MMKRWFVYVGRGGPTAPSPFRLMGTVEAMCETLFVPSMPMFQGAREKAQALYPNELIEVVEAGTVQGPGRIGNTIPTLGKVIKEQLNGTES